VRVRVPATECSRISSAFLEDERRTMGEAWFAQEYLCEFVEGNDALFRDADLEACLRTDVPALF
jgi:hypothetical protein